MTQHKTHHYEVNTSWSSALAGPTHNYRSYSREHRIEIEGKAPLHASAEPAFRGDETLHNPEDLLLASLSGCHLLWYLHLCAVNQVEVLEYLDRASGVMLESPGAGRFQEVVLRPQVTISASSDEAVALQLHEQAHRECFIANSVNFPVRHEPVITRAQPEAPST
ncbi:MAG: OsmC family protein [SAR324 cluster bacterium]|nr:OsmC family protein [SAR324 cluster bacterium]MCZ6842890.1 OsmC family protein [SAR324 cluster bacterium]